MTPPQRAFHHGSLAVSTANCFANVASGHLPLQCQHPKLVRVTRVLLRLEARPLHQILTRSVLDMDLACENDSCQAEGRCAPRSLGADLADDVVSEEPTLPSLRTLNRNCGDEYLQHLGALVETKVCRAHDFAGFVPPNQQ